MTPDEMAGLKAELKAELKSLNISLNGIQTAIALLKERSDHTERTCPYRVEIARNANGIIEIRQDVRDTLLVAQRAMEVAQDNRVKIAQLIGSGVVGGGFVAVLQAIVAAAQ